VGKTKKSVDLEFDNPETSTQQLRGCILAIGNFDGVHVGHQKLITEASRKAKTAGIPVCVLTFRPHPQEILYPEREFRYILSEKDKIMYLKENGADVICFIRFTKEIAEMEPEEFVEKILWQFLRPQEVIVGYNFSFGAQGKGTPELMSTLAQKIGFETTIIGPVRIDNEVVSSTLIRNYLAIGDVKKVAKLMGRRFGFEGKVIKGKGLGRTFNVPTANLAPPPKIFLPAEGVYASLVWLEDLWYKSITNIGSNPTFNEKDISIETFILDFKEDIYNQILRLEFESFLRKEIKFSDAKELVRQIKKDIARASLILEKE